MSSAVLSPGPTSPDVASPIATLRPGDVVDGVYACARKERLLARTGTPYLTVELRDRSGAIAGRAFRGADALASTFERGDLVRVSGRVQRFRDQIQLELHTIARAADAHSDPGRFLPAAYRDLDELDGFFEHLAGELADPPLRGLLERLLADAELRTQLRRAPCTRGGHHAYLGGLLEHTVGVGTLALEVSQLHPRLDRDLLLCAALVHDIGKTREFTYGADFGLTDEGALLGHVQLGLALLAVHYPPGLQAGRRLALEHCVLCHHGPEQAPARRFGSAEALALYRLNALESTVKAALEHGLPGPGGALRRPGPSASDGPPSG